MADHRSLRVLLGATLLLLAVSSYADNADTRPEPMSTGSGWCAPELETVGDACYVPRSAEPTDGAAQASAGDAGPVLREQSKPRTLVIFLHSLVGNGTPWQWQQQRLIARIAQRHGLAALIPHGRLGIGPGRDPNTWAWPTSSSKQEQWEETLINEWATAREAIEAKHGQFERVFIFGFSNGAYYGASLALRGRLPVDGYALFAGGSGARYLGNKARQVSHRPPIFVGYGTKDPDHRRQQSLARLLRQLDWPSRSQAARVGHTVTNAQLKAAVNYLMPPPPPPAQPHQP